jgi:acetolactate synthase regulatory subunit
MFPASVRPEVEGAILQRREKIFWLIAGFALILGVISLIPAHYEICKEGAKIGEEACTSYNLVPFLIIQISKVLDALSVAITALATIAIAWFTLSLRRSTDKLWDAGERQLALLADTSAAQSRDMEASIFAAQKAADAAHLNAESVINSERAFLFLQIQGNNLDAMIAGAAQLDADDPYETGAIWVKYAFQNYGRTAAIIKEVNHHLVHKLRLPEMREYAPISPLLIEHIVARDAVSQPLHCAIEDKINVKDAKSIARGDSALWLYGYVSYDDAFGWGRELRYIWHFNGGSGGFRLYSYREHEAKHTKT